MKHASIPKYSVFFHLMTTGLGEYNSRKTGLEDYPYNSDAVKVTVFFPGWGHAGQDMAILPSGNESAVGQW